MFSSLSEDAQFEEMKMISAQKALQLFIKSVSATDLSNLQEPTPLLEDTEAQSEQIDDAEAQSEQCAIDISDDDSIEAIHDRKANDKKKKAYVKSIN